MGAFFMFVPPVIAALRALERLARQSFRGTIRGLFVTKILSLGHLICPNPAAQILGTLSFGIAWS
jgi:hypothetical protein